MKNALRAVGVLATLIASLVPSAGASAAQPQSPAPTLCTSPQPNGPMRVTADCVDPTYAFPVVYSETDVTTPLPLHKVSGFFFGTLVRFTIYLPPRDQWDGRFFQLVYPLNDENASDRAVGFGAASGGYTVQTNEMNGYRANAAAAKFSEAVAARYYRTDRDIFGYVYGGSGGSYQTTGAIENTTGVWDGAVPVVNGGPTALPVNFMVRAYARFALADEAARIADAVAPGGSGDPYAGLDEAERAVLREVTRMGIPLRAWENYRYMLGLDGPGGGGLGGLTGGSDPTYADDFWTRPGYLGTEQSPLGELFRAAKVDHVATISRVNRNAFGIPTSFVLDTVPASASGLEYTAYRGDGTTKVGSLSGSLDRATRTFTIQSGLELLYAFYGIGEGHKLRIDNRASLAGLAYHRYQVPDDTSLYPWDQFRGPDGQPTTPQRPVEMPYISSDVTGGGTWSGRFDGRVIMVQNMVDADAFPWHADWYARRVRQALGERADDHFRIWFNDNADHLGHVARLWSQDVSDMLGRVEGGNSRLVDYSGSIEQALRDVAAWAESGVVPAGSTRYEIADSQVTVPADAAARRGIQPVVDLTVNGAAADRVDVAAGDPITFEGAITAPPNAGDVVAAEWDFAGTGDFTAGAIGGPGRAVEVQTTHTYTRPGTYFPVLRATGQRDDDTSTPFARVQNLDRVRVVVH
jgi:hypothetical protein